MTHGFNRQWARHAEQQWNQHKGHVVRLVGRAALGPRPCPARRRGWPASSGSPRASSSAARGSAAATSGPRSSTSCATEPMNGYQLITQITERTQGAWKPSPGSVYPTLSQLEDEGLVEGDDDRGRRVLRLTDEGRAYVEANADELAGVWAPFAEPGAREPAPDYSSLKPEIGQVMSAVWQIVSTGTEQQRRDAIEILVDTRRRLYGLLADGDQGEDRARARGSRP